MLNLVLFDVAIMIPMMAVVKAMVTIEPNSGTARHIDLLQDLI